MNLTVSCHGVASTATIALTPTRIAELRRRASEAGDPLRGGALATVWACYWATPNMGPAMTRAVVSPNHVVFFAPGPTGIPTSVTFPVPIPHV